MDPYWGISEVVAKLPVNALFATQTVHRWGTIDGKCAPTRHMASPKQCACGDAGWGKLGVRVCASRALTITVWTS